VGLPNGGKMSDKKIETKECPQDGCDKIVSQFFQCDHVGCDYHENSGCFDHFTFTYGVYRCQQGHKAKMVWQGKTTA